MRRSAADSLAAAGAAVMEAADTPAGSAAATPAARVAPRRARRLGGALDGAGGAERRAGLPDGRGAGSISDGTRPFHASPPIGERRDGRGERGPTEKGDG